MKLNWFSPLPPAATDIGHFTSRVLPSLAARAEVTLWTDQSKWDTAVTEFADVRHYDGREIPWADLNRGDVSVYNIGNNPLFHGSIWEIARRHAGVVILHDTRLHHFFDGLYRVQQRDLTGYLELMDFYYGPEGRQDAYDCFISEARNINEMAAKYPLTELAMENALGVVVHTQTAHDDLSGRTATPLRYLPLPFSAGLRSGVAARKSTRPYRLILFGYIGRNRRLDAVLKALADLPQREEFRLDVYGSILDDEKHVRAQVRALGLKSLVTFHGFATEAELDDALEEADLAINLRYPTMGEASGSQLRIWAHALPSLVTKVGWYATLPPDAVGFVSPDKDEIAGIQAHLQAFLEEPQRFHQMGKNGFEILKEQHTPEQYAEGLLEFLTKAAERRAQAAALRLAEQVGVVTADLFGSAPESMLVSVAREIRALTHTDR
jgi:glycosyltransferase involved in cell wall biosynthesis